MLGQNGIEREYAPSGNYIAGKEMYHPVIPFKFPESKYSTSIKKYGPTPLQYSTSKKKTWP